MTAHSDEKNENARVSKRTHSNNSHKQTHGETGVALENEKQDYLSILKKNQNNIMPLLSKSNENERASSAGSNERILDSGESPYFQAQKQTPNQAYLAFKSTKGALAKAKEATKSPEGTQNENSPEKKGIKKNSGVITHCSLAEMLNERQAQKKGEAEQRKTIGTKNLASKMIDLREKLVAYNPKKTDFLVFGNIGNPRTPRKKEKTTNNTTQLRGAGVKSMKIRSPETSIDTKPHHLREARESIF